MTATPAVTFAAEVRRRRERRRIVGFWVSMAAMVAVIATVVMMAIGFNSSWWVQKDPVASTDQRGPDGSSSFSQAGIDFFTRTGAVDVTMGAGRPTATQLGLAPSGTKHIDFLVPLTVSATAAHAVKLELIDSLDIVTADDRVSAIEISPSGGYQQLLGEVKSLAPEVGWSSSAVTAFMSDLITSRQAHHGDSFSATIGPASSTGMRVSATLSGDQTSEPTLLIRVDAAK